MQSLELVAEFQHQKDAKVFVAMIPVILENHFSLVIPTIYMEGYEIVRKYHLSDESSENPLREKAMIRYKLQDPRIVCVTIPAIPLLISDTANYIRNNKGDYFHKDCDIGY